MSISVSKRIRFFRRLRCMTQKQLGVAVGFPVKTADVRMAQYEMGARTPKAGLREQLANTLGVSANALAIPDVDSTVGLMHTLFALEDIYGFQITDSPEGLCLRLNEASLPRSGELRMALLMWYTLRQEMEAGILAKAEYDQWRYNYSGAEHERNEVDDENDGI